MGRIASAARKKIGTPIGTPVLDLEGELGDEQPFFIEGCQRDWDALPRPDGPLTVGIDGGYVHARDGDNRKAGWFELWGGKSVPTDGAAKCFGFVTSYDTKPKRRLAELLKAQGLQMNQAITFLSDGGDNVRDRKLYLSPLAEHLLDWFHITMRIPVLRQQLKELITVAPDHDLEQLDDELARVIRYANRVPLLYQQAGCATFKSVLETAWKNYGISQSRGALPAGPMVIFVHMASVWVPFTSESKEAIADYDEIRKEMKLALMECGRKLGTYLRKRQKMEREAARRDVFERYIGEISKAMIRAILSNAGANAAIANLVSELSTPESRATRLMKIR